MRARISEIFHSKFFIAGLIFGYSLFYYITLTAPDSTWVNADHDGNNYIMAAKYLTLSHPTGAPLYNLLNWGLIRLPIPGTDFFAIAVWSAVASSCTATLLYWMTKKAIAPIVFLASGLVVSQSTIVETYALVTFVMVLSYYLHTRDKHLLKYVVIGLGLAVHHLPVLMIPPFLAHDYLNKRDLRNVLGVLIGLPFYAYIPLVNNEESPWIGGRSFKDYLDYFFAQGGLIGGLALYPTDNLLMRSRDLTVILLTGFLSAFPIIIFAAYQQIRDKDWLLVTLIALPTVYYFSMLTSNAYVYMVPVIAFGAILVSKIKLSSPTKAVVFTTSAAVIIWNMATYDIGVTLDPTLSAADYYAQLENLPSDAVVFTGDSGWERGSIWLYNRDTGSNIVAVSGVDYWATPEDKLENLNHLIRGRNEDKLYRSIPMNAEMKTAFISSWDPEIEEIVSVVRLGDTRWLEEKS